MDTCAGFLLSTSQRFSFTPSESGLPAALEIQHCSISPQSYRNSLEARQNEVPGGSARYVSLTRHHMAFYSLLSLYRRKAHCGIQRHLFSGFDKVSERAGGRSLLCGWPWPVEPSLRLRSDRSERMLSGSVGFLATDGEELTLIPKLEGNEGSGIWGIHPSRPRLCTVPWKGHLILD